MKFKSALKVTEVFKGLTKDLQAGPLHIRRCHHCGTLNEAENHLVDRCQHCEKQLISFFYFDECKALGLPSLRKKSQKTRLPLDHYPPILGLTVYWEKSSESSSS